MKKSILLFVTCFTMNLAYCQFTAIPDPNFEAFLEANGMGDGIPNNGLVLTVNIENVTQLNVNFQNISDLTGIEDFLALEELLCSVNTLTSLDVSQNAALTLLGCSFNQLTSLDLSQNTALTLFGCQGNQISNLSFINNINLTEIYCSENQLTNLDISQNVSLRILECQENLLTILDLSNNSALEQLNCSINFLTSLETFLNDNLIAINCSRNNITSLSVSQNLELTSLVCPFNNIESLDLSQNLNLVNLLSQSNNNLNYLDVRNNNNANMAVNVTDSDLTCIFVDDAGASYLDDWMIDPFTTFVNNDAECDALSVPSFNEYKLVIYPNPAHEFIIVSLRSSADYTITAANGSLFKKGQLKEGLNKISMADLSTGLYFIRVTSENGIATKKIIKR